MSAPEMSDSELAEHYCEVIETAMSGCAPCRPESVTMALAACLGDVIASSPADMTEAVLSGVLSGIRSRVAAIRRGDIKSGVSTKPVDRRAHLN